MKGRHGGARPGSGPKSELSLAQQVRVGMMFEEVWNCLHRTEPNYRVNKKNVAIHKSKKNATIGRKIKELQEKNTTLPKPLRLVSPEHARRMRLPKSIDTLLPATRVVKTRLRRPYREGQELTDCVIKWCEETFGITITPRQVDYYRTKYRRLTKHKKPPT
jgi:hypothetical protein